MWAISTEPLPKASGLRGFVNHGDQGATFEQVIRAWREDREFRTQFNAALAAAPYSAFRWETPALSRDTQGRLFEFVLLDSPGLASRPDAAAFADFFPAARDGVTIFPNLSGDAVLIVPCPVGKHSAYGHLAAFVRGAPPEQRDALWQAVGQTLIERISTTPLWLSTAGAGVSWLHVRLDQRPKYYGYEPYRRS